MPLPSSFARTRAFSVLLLAVACIGCQGVAASRATPNPSATNPEGAVPAVAAGPQAVLAPGEEIELFDGSTLGMWKNANSGNGDVVRVSDGAIELDWGHAGTAVSWTGTQIPASYELTLQVMRIEGSGSGYWFLSFPVDSDRSCTLTLANTMGWLCDASGPVGDGAITRAFTLDSGTWHTIRLQVSRGRIEAEIDGEQLAVAPVQASPAELSGNPHAPALEIATWSMSAAVRDIRLKRLPDGVR